MDGGRARKVDGDQPDCAPGRENGGRTRNPPLVGTVCALDRVRPAPGELSRLASIQHGCVHRRQLLLAGVASDAIAHRLKTHRYVALHRAVYLIDPAWQDEWTPTMAAVLRFAGDALVTGRSAGARWSLLDEMPAEPEVTVVGRSAHTTTGLNIRRVNQIDRHDVAWRGGLPLTSVAKTIVDLAAQLSILELESTIAAALAARLTTIPRIREVMHRYPRRPGIGVLRRLLDQDGFARTRSTYERKLLALIAQAGLPRPLTNHRVEGHEVDLVWPDQKLVVEFDSITFHSDRRAFERDRRRDQDLVAAGYRVIRVTARQVEQEPFALIVRLALALHASGR